MEEFGLYLFRSALWITGFTLVWLVFLRNEAFFHLKRIYLVAGILASFLLPLITIRYAVEIPVEIPVEVPVESFSPAYESTITDLHEGASLPVPGHNVNLVLLFYLAGVAVFFGRLIWYSASLFGKAFLAPGNAEDGKIIMSAAISAPFSFFGYIFIDPELSGSRLREIINHEMAHIRQKHWIDLVLAELLCILQWFNPVAWIYTGFVRQNHEYLADREALRKSSDPAFYKATLLNQLFGSSVIPLTNPFIASLNKKRFDMMKKTAIHPLRKLRLLPLLPVMALIFWFCSEEYYDVISVEADGPETVQEFLHDPVRVSGLVFGDSDPIRGARVTVSGSSIRAVTDQEGYFEMDVPEGSSITISATGYSPTTLRHLFWREPDDPLSIGVRLYKDGVNRVKTAPPPRPSIQVFDGVIQPGTGPLPPGFDFRNYEWPITLSGEEAMKIYGPQARAGARIYTTRKEDSPSSVRYRVLFGEQDRVREDLFHP
jgi:hypothetical protein